MAELLKLTTDHLQAIARLHVRGLDSGEIRDRLAEGVGDGHGGRLPPVEISGSGIRYHLREGAEVPAMVDALREEQWGQVRSSRIAWAGWRVRELEKLYEGAAAEAQAAEGKAKERWVRLALRALDQAADELPSEEGRRGRAGGDRHVHLHAGDPDTRERLERRLLELAGELTDAELLDLDPQAAPAQANEGEGEGGSDQADDQTTSQPNPEGPGSPP